jgi:platelet-activating factor acetylhydrolase IB subunit alpha
MVAYLSSIGATQSSNTLREELEIGEGFDEATRKKYEGLLEKKWTGIARLQRKVRGSDDLRGREELLTAFHCSQRSDLRSRS